MKTVPRRLEALWRVAATGLCFAAFGLGSLVVRVVGLPVLYACVKSPRARTRQAKQWVRWGFFTFVQFMKIVGVLTYEAHGVEKLQRAGLLILANHPSLIDIVFLMALTPRSDCLVKGPLRTNFITGPLVRAAGYAFNDTGDQLLTQCIASVRAQNSLIIFPEGTRSPVSGPLSLQRGAAHVALRGHINVTPVLISCDPPVLTKGHRWYRVPARRPHFKIEVHNDIVVLPFLEGSDSMAMAARRLTAYLTQYFTRSGTHANS